MTSVAYTQERPATSQAASAAAREELVRRALGLLVGTGVDDEIQGIYADGFSTREESPYAPVGATRLNERHFTEFARPRLEVIHVDAGSEWIVSRVRFDGYYGASSGWRGTLGRPVAAHGAIVHHVEGGRITDAWAQLSWAGWA